LVTPHGRDFDYQAAGGTLNMTPIPDLYLRAPVLPFPARARGRERTQNVSRSFSTARQFFAAKLRNSAKRHVNQFAQG
jgi:hypothetical protein